MKTTTEVKLLLSLAWPITLHYQIALHAMWLTLMIAKWR